MTTAPWAIVATSPSAARPHKPARTKHAAPSPLPPGEGRRAAAVGGSRGEGVVKHPAASINDAVGALVAVHVDRILKSKGLLRDELSPRGLRIRAGLKLIDLAAKSGLSQNTVSSIERGQTRDPAPETTAALAEALGISAREYREAVARMEVKHA